ncbi:MAG: NADH:flavin oxidoreductase/NADH oxidase [Ferruginibacter sp.]
MPKLFDSLKIRNIILKNRIVVSPMCEYSSVDGFANDWHLVHLGTRAIGGAGLVMTEAAAVTAVGRITPDDLGIWKDDHIPFLKRITVFIEDNGAVPGIQLAHAGRKASHNSPWKGSKVLTKQEGGWDTLAPSTLPYLDSEPLPIAMTKDDITKLIHDFSDACQRAITAGFKVIEIHAAHGYLINEFLSPLSNNRLDEYGGTFENRISILVEITKAIRKIIGEGLPLFVRISATDWVSGGWDENDSVELSKILKAEGADLIDCSSGGNSPLQKIPVGPLYQVPFSSKIKQFSGIATGAVGMITTALQAEDILMQGKADLIIMARELLRNPYFPLHAALELGAEITWPVQYERAKKK